MTRRVLITAGANGIGLVMARAFAALGDRVWVTDVDAAAVAALPPGIRGTVCDASSEAAMDVLFAEVTRDWGGLDVAIANAPLTKSFAIVTLRDNGTGYDGDDFIRATLTTSTNRCGATCDFITKPSIPICRSCSTGTCKSYKEVMMIFMAG